MNAAGNDLGEASGRAALLLVEALMLMLIDKKIIEREELVSLVGDLADGQRFDCGVAERPSRSAALLGILAKIEVSLSAA